MKKVVLLFLLILGPGLLAITSTSCDQGETPYFELISQQTTNANGGNFSQVFVEIRYERRRYVAYDWSLASLAPAYATSPAPPRLRFKIASIVVTADKSFGPAHPAGANLSEYFEINDFRGTPVSYPVKYLEGFGFFMRMKKAPTAAVETILTVTTTFEHGPSLTSSTPELSIN